MFFKVLCQTPQNLTNRQRTAMLEFASDDEFDGAVDGFLGSGNKRISSPQLQN